MATDLRESWWGRHFEKVVVLAAGLVFVVSVVLWVVLRESHVEKREVIHRLIEEINKRKEATIKDVLPEEEQRQLGLTKTPLTVAEFERRLAQRLAEWPGGDFVWGIVKGTVKPPIEVKEVTPPNQILAVEEVEIAAGRGVTPEAVSHPLEKMAEQGLSDIAWVSCVGKFNLDLQLEEYLAGKVERQPIVITRVEMSRRERKPDGTWSDWEAVTGQGAKAALDRLPRRPENSRDTRAVIAWARGLLAMQEDVRRIPFVGLVARDPEGKWVQDIAGEVKGVEQPNLRAAAGAGAPARGAPAAGAPPPEAALSSEGGPAAPAAPASEAWWLTEPMGPAAPTPGTVPSLIEPVEPQYTYAKLWAHDLSVRPGRTYQYRMRVAVFNPVYGHPNCGNEQAKWTPERVGEWSEPSAAVTIPRLVHFYFVGVFGDRATVELHRWIHGQWVIIRSVPYRVGTPVIYSKPVPIKVPGSGKEVTETVDLSPGVLLVDMIRGFPYTPTGMRPISTNVLVFSDTQGNLGQRIDWEDQKEANQRRQERESVVPGVGPATEKGG